MPRVRSGEWHKCDSKSETSEEAPGLKGKRVEGWLARVETGTQSHDSDMTLIQSENTVRSSSMAIDRIRRR